MTVEKFLYDLGPNGFVPSRDRSKDLSYDLEDVQDSLGIELPEMLVDFLQAYTGAVDFEKGCQFKVDELSGFENPPGYLGLDYFYCLSDISDGLVSRNSTFSDRLPDNFVVIAGELSGNQILIHKQNGGIYYWRHDVHPDRAITRIAPDFETWVSRFEPEPGEDESGDGTLTWS